MAKNQKTDLKSSNSKPKLFKYHLVKGSIWSELKTVKKSKSGRKSGDIWIENEEIEQIRKFGGVFVNDIFIPLWDCKAQLLFLEGSYGSSKTTYAITRLLVQCIESTPGTFKCFYGRREKEMARQLHSNIIREIKRNHWESKFDYSIKPNGTKRIICVENGNEFELFGCDDLETLKGLDNPTHMLVDEINQIDFAEFGMLFSRLRTSGTNLQLIGCFNPCDVMPDHWIVKFIYNKGNASSEAEETVLEALEDMEMVSHHSTYIHNYFQNPDMYLNKLKIQAGGDSERIKDYAEGRWGARLNAQPYYKQFKYDKHVFPSKDLYYNNSLSLLFSFDENVQPYLPAIVAQMHLVPKNVLDSEGKPTTTLKKEIWIIKDVAAENPHNSLYSVCPDLEEEYWDHTSGMEIYGDATSLKDDTKLEEGQNFFTIAQGLLKKFDPTLRIPNANPNNKIRGNFINMILKEEIYDIVIKISDECEKLIEDYQNTMEALDERGSRTGKKDKSTKMVKGVRQVQPHGHLCDCVDYLICELCQEEYDLFQNDGQSYDPSGGRRPVKNSAYNDKYSRKNSGGEDVEEYSRIKRKSKNSSW